MEQQVESKWTDEDEAAFQALMDEQNEAYEQSVCASYAARGQANTY